MPAVANRHRAVAGGVRARHPGVPELWRHVLPRISGARLVYLDLEQVVLVGHDLGGGTAQILAATQWDRVAGWLATSSPA